MGCPPCSSFFRLLTAGFFCAMNGREAQRMKIHQKMNKITSDRKEKCPALSFLSYSMQDKKGGGV